MFAVISYQYSTTDHAQRLSLFCSSMTKLQRSGAPLDPGPLSLVLLPTNLKSILGQYRGGGPGLERGRKEEEPMTAHPL